MNESTDQINDTTSSPTKLMIDETLENKQEVSLLDESTVQKQNLDIESEKKMETDEENKNIENKKLESINPLNQPTNLTSFA